MKELLLVACFGAVGAVSRFLLSAWTLRTFGDTFPVGTFLVNVLGCGFIGALFQLDTLRTFSPEWRTAIAAGFLGGLTTFSTFGLETVRLVELGRPAMAIANVVANVALGLVAVALGMMLVRWIVSR